MPFFIKSIESVRCRRTFIDFDAKIDEETGFYI